MIRIDLGKDAEERAKSKKKSKGKVQAPAEERSSGKSLGKDDVSGMVFLLGALAFAFLPYLFVEQHKERTREKNKEATAAVEVERNKIREEIKHYESYKVELENFEKQTKLLNDRLAAVTELLGARNGPVNVLDAMGQSLPSGAWLTEISFSSSGKPGLFFSGRAYSHEDVTDFADKLSASIFFEKVSLESVNDSGDTGKGVGVKNFSFQAFPKINNRLPASGLSENKTEKP